MNLEQTFQRKLAFPHDFAYTKVKKIARRDQGMNASPKKHGGEGSLL